MKKRRGKRNKGERELKEAKLKRGKKEQLLQKPLKPGEFRASSRARIQNCPGIPRPAVPEASTHCASGLCVSPVPSPQTWQVPGSSPFQKTLREG